MSAIDVGLGRDTSYVIYLLTPVCDYFLSFLSCGAAATSAFPPTGLHTPVHFSILPPYSVIDQALWTTSFPWSFMHRLMPYIKELQPISHLSSPQHGTPITPDFSLSLKCPSSFHTFFVKFYPYFQAQFKCPPFSIQDAQRSCVPITMMLLFTS